VQGSERNHRAHRASASGYGVRPVSAATGG